MCLCEMVYRGKTTSTKESIFSLTCPREMTVIEEEKELCAASVDMESVPISGPAWTAWWCILSKRSLLGILGYKEDGL